jgi:ABC-type antimicrobial peptide transport system permease subunit
MMYTPYAQSPARTMTIVIRAASDPLSLVPAARSEIRQADAEQPIDRVRTMSEVASGAIAQQRFSMMLFAIFAGLALLLAMIGIYGVMSYAVQQRTREVGIRMALGASHRDVIAMIVWQGARLTVTGVAGGLVAAFGLTRLMSNLLFGVSARDPLTFAAIALLISGTALVACYIPARRATRVDPMIALRYE